MPKHEHHPFENQIFGHFREEAKKVKKRAIATKKPKKPSKSKRA